MAHNNLDSQIMDKMFMLSRVMKESITFNGEIADLTLLQLQALVYIKKNKQTTMSDLANQFAISLPTATALSDKLIKVGYAQRTRSTTDRRVVYLALTDKGTQLLQKALKQRNTKIEHMLGFLAEDKKEQLLEILTSLLSDIQNQYETT